MPSDLRVPGLYLREEQCSTTLDGLSCSHGLYWKSHTDPWKAGALFQCLNHSFLSASSSPLRGVAKQLCPPLSVHWVLRDLQLSEMNENFKKLIATIVP